MEFHYRWEWPLRSSALALWPYLANTNQFNCDTRVPAVSEFYKPPRPDTIGRRYLKLKLFGMTLKWIEEPFQWVRPFQFGVVRRYQNGPLREMRVIVELHSPDQAWERPGTTAVYKVWAKPRGLIGFIIIPIQIGWISAYHFKTVFNKYDTLASQVKPLLAHTSGSASIPPQFPAGGLKRLAILKTELEKKTSHPEWVEKLDRLLRQADDMTVNHLRPYASADLWKIPRRELLELFLHATRIGLLEFRWDLLCPLCRGAKQTRMTLREIDPNVHCDSCNIDFTANFDRSVELTFRPNPAVRSLNVAEYCIGGPEVTPHIVTQQILAPGMNLKISVPVEEGRYRIRTKFKNGSQSIYAKTDGANLVRININDQPWPNEERVCSLNPTIHLENQTSMEQLFVMERFGWSDQAVTAAEVTLMQTFRDLFSQEALRPGNQISVGSLALVFTDLRGSTKFYRDIGDAPAFGHVMNHFDILQLCVNRYDGAIVKTIGDAIMAAFRRPLSALQAMLEAQRQLAHPAKPGQLPLKLKAGIHYGACIAVNLNDRLDYFGSTVNLASRLEGHSTGGEDIIISDPIFSDPEVQALLSASENHLTVQPYDTTLKGFDQEAFRLWRVSKKPL